MLKNFIALAGAEAVSKLLTFAAFAYLARVSGPDGFGYVEFAGAVLLCAGLIVDQGFSPYGAREIAKKPEQTTTLVSEIVLARFILAICSYLVVVTFAWLLNGPPILTRLLLIYGVSLLALPLLLQWVFQGHERMQTVAAMQVIRQAVFAGLVFGLVRDASQIWLVAFAEIAGVCSAAAYGMWKYWRVFGSALRGRLTISRRLFREGTPIGLSQMFWVVKMFGATLILGTIATAEDVGFFAGAMRILAAMHTFVWLYYFNLLPSLSKACQQGTHEFSGLVDRSMHAVVWVSVAAGLVWILLAPTVMTSVYGAAFAPAGTSLQWMAGVFVLAAISGHYRFGLIACGRQTAEMATAALGALVAATLIPIGYAKGGPTGAAMALFAAEFVVWLSAWWCARRMLGLRGHVKLLIRPGLVAGLMAGLFWWFPSHLLILRVIAAASSVILLSFALDVGVRDQFRKFQLMRRHGDAELLSKSLPEVLR